MKYSVIKQTKTAKKRMYLNRMYYKAKMKAEALKETAAKTTKIFIKTSSNHLYEVVPGTRKEYITYKVY